jgi:hypothetical protein
MPLGFALIAVIGFPKRRATQATLEPIPIRLNLDVL